jgi:hypothetical protein
MTLGRRNAIALRGRVDLSVCLWFALAQAGAHGRRRV